MTVDNIPESYSGLYYSRAMAEHAAAGLQAEGRITKVEESNLHIGQWVLYATPKPEKSSTPVEVGLVENPIENLPPIDLSNQGNLLFTYRSQVAAESAAETFRAEGRRTAVVESQLHANGWVLYATRLPEDEAK